MSFWKGLGRAMESNEAQRNVEDARDEREAARAKDEAWRIKTFEYGANRDTLLDERYEAKTLAERERRLAEEKRQGVTDTRLAEAHRLAMATGNFTLTKSIDGLAGVTSTGNRRTGAGSIPTPSEMGKGARALQARIDDVGGLSGMTKAQQDYYEPILSNVAASYEMNKLLAKAVGDDTDLTILNAADRVRTVAVVAAQGQEAFEEYRDEAAKDGWDPEEVLEAMKLAKNANPDFAELVLLTPSKKNLTEQEVYKTFESSLQSRAVLWSRTNGVTPEFNSAMGRLTSDNEQIKQGAILDLVAMGVGQSWLQEYTGPGNPLYDLSPKSVSAVPRVGKDGDLIIGGDTPPADIPTFDTEADILALTPDEQDALVGKPVIVGGVKGVFSGPELPTNTPEDKPAWGVQPVVETPTAPGGRGPNKLEPTVAGPMDNMTEEEVRSQLDDPNITNEGINRVYDILDERFPLIGRGSRRHPRPNLEMSSGLDNPKVRDALSNVPAEVKGAVVSIVEENDPEAIEGAISEITEEYGEDVAVSLFTEAGYQPGNLRSISRTVAALHGEGSETTNRINNLIKTVDSGGSVNASDVTKLIKETKALPRSPGRQDLLADLYDMRDEAGGR